VILVVLVDMTRRKEMERELQRLANTDPLTGLANRTRFFAAAAAEIKRASRRGWPLAVLMADIDHFKRINDSCGHDRDDLALRACADRCRQSVREEDVVARLGGEEFGFLLPETSWSDAFALAERMRGAIEALSLEGLDRPMTVSIGLAEVGPDEASVGAALSRADHALYLAKRTGRNQVVRYLLPEDREPTRA
jgi:diguanylate cyclase (GGDEF)-like protein